jgi:hypothetical protein
MDRDILTNQCIGVNSAPILTEISEGVFKYLQYNWSTISEIFDFYNLKGKGSIQDICIEQEDIVFFKSYFENRKPILDKINNEINICL